MLSSFILARLLRDDRGATAIEYGLIASLIVIAIIGALKSVGMGSGGLWAVMSQKVISALVN